jgi:hypothetical protein
MENKGLVVSLEPLVLEAIELGYDDPQTIMWIMSKADIDFDKASELFNTVKGVFEEGM